MTGSHDDAGAEGHSAAADGGFITEGIAVVVCDLFPFGDGPPGAEPDLSVDTDALRIGLTGMVGVTRQVPCHRAVDESSSVGLEDVNVALFRHTFTLFRRDLRTLVFDDRGSFRNIRASKKPPSVNAGRCGMDPTIISAV